VDDWLVAGLSPDLVGHRRHVLVHERRGLRGEPEGFSGDPAGLPRRQLPGGELVPVPGQPVPQFQALTEEPLPGLGGQPDRGRELRHRVLRHRRRAVAGQGQPGLVAAPVEVGGRLVQRVLGMHDHPLDGELTQPGLGCVGGLAFGSGSGQHAGSRLRPVGDWCARAHTSIGSDGTDSHPSEAGVVHRDARNFLELSSGEGWFRDARRARSSTTETSRRGLDKLDRRTRRDPVTVSGAGTTGTSPGLETLAGARSSTTDE